MLKYIWKENWFQVVVITLLSIFLIWYSYCGYSDDLMSEIIGKFLPIATLMIGCFLWYNEQKENYMNQLPKKLNVKYQLDEKYFEIVNAPLAHEGDIRAWGQAIAKNVLNESQYVEYSGYFIDTPRIIEGRKFYSITIYLKKAIGGFEFGKSYYFGNDGKYIGLKNS
ncbi:MAG: hypothetical protein IPG55_06785 [Saprospiraceae bacterium]|nr:hypothetical protein [Candidatus Defluviibacterium haderslevense]MBK7245684.1 hypothetical protein [Candidatus Defluviibacterium haderslevense]